LNLNEGSASSSTLPARDTTACNNGYGANSCGRAHYDLYVGNAGAQASIQGGDFGYATGIVEARDDFRVVGIPAGTPVAFTARFTLVSTVSTPSSSGYLRARLREEISATERAVEGFAALNQTLELAITTLAESPFRLALYLEAQRNARGTDAIEGSLSFAGLPNGASIQSCQNPATTVTRGTWGRVKAAYR
jgi:hypothetical protein